MDNYTNHLDDDSNRNESFANLSSKYFGFEDRANRTTKSPANTSRLFKSSILQSNANTSLRNASIVNNDLDHGAHNGQSSIYTQFKIDTNKFIDEDNNLIELLNSYSTICGEHSHFLKEKLQYLTTSRQKYLEIYYYICAYQD
jgi:hypothetical protein